MRRKDFGGDGAGKPELSLVCSGCKPNASRINRISREKAQKGRLGIAAKEHSEGQNPSNAAPLRFGWWVRIDC
jgi:hypothetical protein